MEEDNLTLLRNYKTNQPIESVDDLPVPSAERIQTDRFCIIFSTLFAVGMFVTAIACLDLNKLQRMTYPTDQQGRHCTLDNGNYNYLYFTSPSDPAKRLCLEQCPKGNEEKLECWPTENLSCAKNGNANFQVAIYASIPSQTSLGLFCKAEDRNLNTKLLQNANLFEMYEFVSAYISIGISFLAAIVFGILGVIAFSYFPGLMSYFSIITGGIGCILTAIFLFSAESTLLATYRTAVTLFALVFIFIGVLLLYASIWRQRDIKISIEYLEKASVCFWQFPQLAGVSIVFIILLVGLTALCGFQELAFWSSADMKFQPNSVYVHPEGGFAVFMTVLNVIEFIWGLSFLKEAFNLLISGTTVHWHFTERHSLPFAMGNLFKYHWGSVVAGAFLLHFVYPIDLIYDIFKPSQTNHGAYRRFCCCCQRVLDLARSQAMVLINIAGMPYCNASRWCEKILYHSQKVDGSSSSNRFVRIGGHVVLALLSTLVSFIYMKNTGDGNVSVLALIFSFLINIFVLTFFICLIKDTVQAIFFCNNLDEYYQNFDTKSVAKKLFPDDGYEVLPTTPK